MRSSSSWILVGAAIAAVGWWLLSRRFAALPVPPAAFAAARAARAAARARAGLPPDGAPGSPFGPRHDPFDPSQVTFHAGVDVACPVGTPLLAVDDGVIVEARDSVSAGKLIRYDTDKGRVSAMHLSELHVSVGDRVVAGQQIGTTGDTGRVTGPHLHLEFKPHGSKHAVDPLPFFPV
jgi:murein DD-endopeptidase MepM/ murein hydrolase activator NlpD